MKKQLLFLVTLLFPILIYTQTTEEYPVTWVNEVGVSIDGNTLTKTLASSDWNAGASSKNQLEEGENGWLRVKVEEINTKRMIGLSQIDKNIDYTTIDYAMYLHSNGTLYVNEKGVSKGQFSAYQAGDQLSVERQGAAILYKINGALFYTSTTPSYSTLIVDASIYHQNGTLLEAETSFGIPPNAPKEVRFGYDIEWTDAVNMATNNNDLIKTGAAGWNASATSENVLPANTDGWVEVNVEQRNTSRMFGLATPNKKSDYKTINFAIYLVSNGEIRIHEKGTYRGIKGYYQRGDVMSVERVGGTIYYKQNGNTIYTSLTASTEELIADVAFHNTQATLFNARASFIIIPKSSIAGIPVIWTNEKNVEVNNNTLTKTLASTDWNAGASSKNQLEEGENGWVRVKVEEINTKRMIGLSQIDKDLNYTTIDYAMYLHQNGTLYVNEKGVSKGQFSAYQAGDQLSVERQGAAILYKRNGDLFYTSITPSYSQLIVDASIYHQNGTLLEAETSFGIPPNAPKEVRFGYDIEWTDAVNMATNNNDLIKTGAAGWNASATSENVLPANTDGWVEVNVEQRNTSRMFGLATPNKKSDYKTINFAIYLVSNGEIRIHEKGTYRGIKGYYQRGDVMSVERVGGTIYYKQNGNTIYTSLTASTEELIADVAFHNTQATLFNARASFPTPSKETITASFFVPDDHPDDVDIRYSDGKVVIGDDSTLKPGDYRLFVEDGILTEEVVIALKNTNQWADYVFEKDYPRNSIEQVAQFIQENKHLPNVPSAKEVVDKGIKVGEMNAVLLRQIEELWLMMIEQEKRMKVLEGENERLKKKLLPSTEKE